MARVRHVRFGGYHVRAVADEPDRAGGTEEGGGGGSGHLNLD